jgi:hypothetical protein
MNRNRIFRILVLSIVSVIALFTAIVIVLRQNPDIFAHAQISAFFNFVNAPLFLLLTAFRLSWNPIAIIVGLLVYWAILGAGLGGIAILLVGLSSTRGSKD